jgi:hypothetical protein
MNAVAEMRELRMSVRAVNCAVAEASIHAILRRRVWQSIGRECTVVAAMNASASIWLPMATALHRLADGSSHFDWFFGRSPDTSDPDARSARAFRCVCDPRESSVGWTTPLEPLADHRVHYLTTREERELADGSTVTPLKRGQWMKAREQRAHGDSPTRPGDSTEEIIIQWDGCSAFHRIRLTGLPPRRAHCTASGPLPHSL